MAYMKKEKKEFKAIANELKELTEQIDKIGKDTTFNGIHLLNGELEEGRELKTSKLRLHIG